jgi:hypothetical protein
MRTLRIAFILTAVLLWGIDPAQKGRWADRNEAIFDIVRAVA